MKNRIVITVAGLISLFAVLTSWDTYKIASLHSLAPGLISFSQDPKITVFAKAYTADESVANLDRNLQRRGIQPIQVTIHNNTSKTLSICPSSFDLPTISPKEAAQKVWKSSIPRSIGFSIASFFFWPFMIPSAVNTILTARSHAQLSEDFAVKAVKEEVISPFSTINRILFVKKKDYKNNITLTVIDLNTLEPLSFDTMTNPTKPSSG